VLVVAVAAVVWVSGDGNIGSMCDSHDFLQAVAISNVSERTIGIVRRVSLTLWSCKIVMYHFLSLNVEAFFFFLVKEMFVVVNL
jgi:hypothetical protein